MSSTATSHSMVSNGSLNIDDVYFEENLTFQQLINEYHADSTLLHQSEDTTNGTINTANNDIDGFRQHIKKYVQ